MFQKMIKVIGLALLALTIFTACTDDEDPDLNTGNSEVPYLTMDNFATANDSITYTIDVTDEDTLLVYWSEAGYGQTANITTSIFKADGITPYKQIDNGKDFLNIDNSTAVNPKRIAVLESKIVVKTKVGDTIGDYTLFVTDEKPYYLGIEDNLADTTVVKNYTVAVGNAKNVTVFWEEMDDNSGETADIQGSVYKMDGVTPYKILDNNKDFVDKDNSSLDNPKEIAVDSLETQIIIHIERDISNPVPGNFKIYVKDTTVE